MRSHTPSHFVAGVLGGVAFTVTTGRRGAFDVEESLALGEVAQAVVGKEANDGREARKMLRRENHALRGGRNYAHSSVIFIPWQKRKRGKQSPVRVVPPKALP